MAGTEGRDAQILQAWKSNSLFSWKMQDFDDNADGVTSQTGIKLQAGDAGRHTRAWRGRGLTEALGVFLENAGMNMGKNLGNSNHQCHTMG